MDAFSRGIYNAVNVCMGVQPDEKVLIISDRTSREVAEALEREAGKVTGNVDSLMLESFGRRPLKGFPEELGNMIRDSDVTFYAAQSVPGEIYPFRRTMLDTIIASKARHAHMPNITKDVVRTGLTVDNERVQEITDSVFRLVSGCKHARISGENGTSVTASFDKKYRWISLGSIVRGRGWTNLPGAEIMTYPATINGVYVVDGVLGDHFVRYGTLEKSPVHIKISDGKAVSISCDNNDLERELTEYIGKDKNGARIGEFALGTNIFLKKFSGILLQDEKFPTVHIALGNPYPKLTGAPYDAKTHVDAVTRNVSVWVDGRKIMEEGTYLI